MNNTIVKYTRLWFAKLAKIQGEDHDVLIWSQYCLRHCEHYESNCEETPEAPFSTVCSLYLS